MGAATSTLDGVFFDDRAEYHRWPLARVEAAHERWLALSRHGEAPHLELTRRQFWDVFTDYEAVVGGAFLSVPMSEFEAYCRGKRAPLVTALEVLTMLALFCDGPVDAKLELIFHMTALSNGHTLLPTDMSALLNHVMRGLAHLGVTKQVLSAAEFTTLSNEMMADADLNVDCEVSFKEFKAWAQAHLKSQELLHRFDLAPPPVGRRPSTVELDATEAKVADDDGDTCDHVVQQLPAAIASEPEFGSVIQLQKRTRAAKLATIANRHILTLLAQKTGFSIAELHAVAQQFCKVSDVVGYLTLHKFSDMLAAHFPGLAEDGLFPKVLQIVDVDKDGRVNFRDFVMSMSTLLKGSLRQKLEILFVLYDADHDGRIDVVELMQMLRVHDQQVVDMIEFAEELLVALDVNGDNLVSRDEFARDFGGNHILHEVFTHATSVSSQPLCALQLHNLRKAFPCCVTLAAVQKLIPHCRGKSCVRIQDAVALLSTKLQLSMSTAGPILDCIMTYYDFEGDGNVSLVDICLGLIQILCDSPDVHSGLVFELFDLDESGTLDRNEILRMVVLAHSRAMSQAAKVLELLERMDANGDGYLSLEEFLATASRQPMLMETLHHVFRISGVFCTLLET